MFARIKKWLMGIDDQIKKNRPSRRPSAPPPQTVFEPITPAELRQLGKEVGVSPKYIEKLIDDHELDATGFELVGRWFQIVGSHK